MNNKNTIGHEHFLSDLNQFIIKYLEITKEKLQWETFTSEFEKALINGFHKTFNKINEEEIHHVDCYFHFLYNCRKRLAKEGYCSYKYKADYDLIMNFISTLPFQYI